MDIIGVEEVSAEAELISAIVMFLESVGLSAKEITIKVSSRKVLQAVLEQYKVPPHAFGPVCVIVDKLDKMPAEKVHIGLSNGLAMIYRTSQHFRKADHGIYSLHIF